MFSSKLRTLYLAQAALMVLSFQAYAGKIFNSDFTPLVSGKILKDPKTKTETALSPAIYSSHGNSNWSQAVEENGESVLRLKVGSGKYQDAIITTKSTAFGFSNSKTGISYKIELGTKDFGSKKRGNGSAEFYIIGHNRNKKIPSSWWAAQNAVMIKFNSSWIGLSIKNLGEAKSSKPSAFLWSTNYKGNIESIELLLTKDSYALAINGIKLKWKSKGEISGKLYLKTPSAFARGRIAISLKQKDVPVKPFYLDVKSINISSIDSPKTK